jgi:hypothetical protein
MSVPDSSNIMDIVLLTLGILFALFLLVTAFFVIRYREYEFNRIWRTRLFLLVIVLLLTTSFLLTVLHWYPSRFAHSNGRSLACSISEFVHNCLLLPFFLSTMMGFVRALGDSSALLSEHPNRGVLCRALIYTIPIALLGIANIVLVAVRQEIRFFRVYSENEEECVISPFYGTLFTVFAVIVFVSLLQRSGLCFRSNDLMAPRLNAVHRQRRRKLPLFMVPFILIGAVSIAGPFLDDPWPRIIGYIACVLGVLVVTIYLYYFILAPLKEASDARLLRGNLTQRHGNFLSDVLNPSSRSSEMENEPPLRP